MIWDVSYTKVWLSTINSYSYCPFRKALQTIYGEYIVFSCLYVCLFVCPFRFRSTLKKTNTIEIWYTVNNELFRRRIEDLSNCSYSSLNMLILHFSHILTTETFDQFNQELFKLDTYIGSEFAVSLHWKLGCGLWYLV